MPGPAFSLPIAACRTGSRLRAVEGSVCSNCYASRGRYRTARVERAMQNRLERLSDPRWVPAMAALIARHAARSGYFRWHDAGDLQSAEHLARIADVCHETPAVRHWLPTREYEFVEQFLAVGGVLPSNLTLRLSAHLIGGPPRDLRSLPVSTVTKEGSPRPSSAFHCAQPSRGRHVCGDCRACWDRSVRWIDYLMR